MFSKSWIIFYQELYGTLPYTDGLLMSDWHLLLPVGTGEWCIFTGAIQF